MEKIDSFRGEHRWLSNFWWCEVRIDGISYPSSEHAYQAQKTLDRNKQKEIAEAKTFKKSKRLGYQVELREDWESIKIDVMLQILREKFKYPGLKELLEETGDAELIEGNDWGDDFWGQVNGRGQNHLGKCLMKIREENRRTK